MKPWTAHAAATALALVWAGAAHADLTAIQVWDKWRAQIEGTGQTVTADTEISGGDTLRLSDVRTVLETPDGTVTSWIETMEFRERPGGTVEITLSPRYEVAMDMVTPDGVPTQAVLAMTHSGLSMIASGNDEAITYDYSADEIAARLDSLTVEDAPEDLTLSLVMGDVSGTYTVAGEAKPEVTGDVTMSAVDMTVAGTDAESGDRIEVVMTYADVEVTNETVLAMAGDGTDTAEMLRQGFAFDTDIAHGAARYTISVDEGNGPSVVSVAMEGGAFGMQFDADGMSVSAETTAMAATMSGPEIPFPELSLSAGATRVGFRMPVQETEAPQDFGLDLALDEVAVSDVLWQIFDPGGNLPRDPATLIVALSGQARWFYDIMDPDLQEDIPDGPPGELTALDLDDLRVSLAGAELTGSGGFIFDNSDLETFDGMPRPTGSVDLTLVGGQTLLEKLVSMGLLPEDQAMGARMMLGLFARPGEGEDTLVSTIEVTEDGAVMANGQRLQ